MAVRPSTDNPARFEPGSVLLVGHDPAGATELVVGSARPQGDDRLLLGFEGVADRTAAQALRGAWIFAAAADLPELEEGVYWERDLLGLRVVDTGGRELGVVSAVVGRTEQDLWEVTTPRGPVLVPAARGIVVSVDLDAGRITVDPPAGLFG